MRHHSPGLFDLTHAIAGKAPGSKTIRRVGTIIQKELKCTTPVARQLPLPLPLRAARALSSPCRTLTAYCVAHRVLRALCPLSPSTTVYLASLSDISCTVYQNLLCLSPAAISDYRKQAHLERRVIVHDRSAWALGLLSQSRSGRNREVTIPKGNILEPALQ
jgi:hypothetical protein